MTITTFAVHNIVRTQLVVINLSIASIFLNWDILSCRGTLTRKVVSQIKSTIADNNKNIEEKPVL